MKHTPGPWKIDGKWIVRGNNHTDDHYYLICEVSGEKGIDNDANLKLIAAAPELLDELQKAHRFLRKNGYPMDSINMAISKAEGE
jgi:hypothetical protein